jgi:uncharacterized membrane protein
MEQMLSADHLEILSWVIDRDMGDYACTDAKFVSPALVHNFTEAARLEDELGSEAYHALHPEAEDLALKSWVVMLIFLKRCSLVGFPIYADLHWTLLGQRVLCAQPQLRTQSAYIGTLAYDIVSILSQTYLCPYAYIYVFVHKYSRCILASQGIVSSCTKDCGQDFGLQVLRQLWDRCAVTRLPCQS